MVSSTTGKEFVEAAEELGEGRHEEGIKTHQPPAGIVQAHSHIKSFDVYKQWYDESINNTEQFWEKVFSFCFRLRFMSVFDV